MVKNILESAAVGKLKDILKDRYGKNLRVQFMQEVSSLTIEEDTFLLSRGDLHVPIQVNDKFFATAVVEDGADLKDDERELVSQLVRLFIEPEVFNWYIDQTTNNLKSSGAPDNVVSLHSKESPTLSQDRPAAATNVLCLQTNNPNLIPRMARNIHDISERWAYLKFSDVEGELKSVEDFKSLGPMTLFIEDILQLSPEKQDLLLSYLSDSIPSQEPLVIVGASTPVEDLEHQEMVSSSLGKILKAHRLEVERLPRDPKLLEETLEFMLEF